jgi:hypothetical protein
MLLIIAGHALFVWALVTGSGEFDGADVRRLQPLSRATLTARATVGFGW